jgi:hypothetical protein
MKTKKTKNFRMLCITSAFILISFFFSGSSFADITPPWACSFDCGREYVLNQDAGDGDWAGFRSCESGVGPNNNSESPDGNFASILYAANNPLGTGLGSRQWMAAGKNIGTSGVAFGFANRLTEFWLRFYFRWEKGF